MLPTNFCTLGAEEFERLLELIGLELTALETGTELEEMLERIDDELCDEVTTPPQAAPFTTGRSAVAPFLFPWNPKDTDWPTGIFPFHPMLVAV